MLKVKEFLIIESNPKQSELEEAINSWLKEQIEKNDIRIRDIRYSANIQHIGGNTVYVQSSALIVYEIAE